MKIGERSDFSAVASVRIPKNGNDVILNVQALPINFQEQLATMLPPPHPASHGSKRLGVATDPKNPHAVLKDASGAPIIMYDLDAPRFKAAKSKHGQLEMIAMFYEATKGINPDLSFDARWEDFEKPAEFFAAVYKEMGAAKFSVGDINIVIRKCVELSNLNEEKIEEAMGGFLSEEYLTEPTVQ